MSHKQRKGPVKLVFACVSHYRLPRWIHLYVNSCVAFNFWNLWHEFVPLCGITTAVAVLNYEEAALHMSVLNYPLYTVSWKSIIFTFVILLFVVGLANGYLQLHTSHSSTSNHAGYLHFLCNRWVYVTVPQQVYNYLKITCWCSLHQHLFHWQLDQLLSRPLCKC